MMKRLIFGCLSVLCISTLISPVQAQETTSDIPLKESTIVIHETSPFNLVYLAYQGFFEDQGIYGGYSFLYKIQFGRINAEQLVQIGVEQRRVSSSKLMDSVYINAVESQLEELIRIGTY